MGQRVTSQSFEHYPLDYDQPEVVQPLSQRWIISYRAIAVVAALLAGMEAWLIVLMKAAEPGSYLPLRWSTPRIHNTILALGYFSINSSIGCILSSGQVMLGLGQMGFPNAITNPEDPSDWTFHTRAAYWINPFGVEGKLRLLMYHSVGSILASGLCALLQICIHIWLHGATSVAVVGSVVVVMVILL